MKKGDISLTTIVVAAIALVVLIVLIAIFTGRINIFGKQYDTQTGDVQARVCNVGGGVFVAKVPGTCPAGGPSHFDDSKSWIDCGGDQACCKPA
jgi:hypothetical protein